MKLSALSLSRPLSRLVLPAAMLAFTSCGHALPSLPGFDSAAWKADIYGCSGQRAKLVPVLEQNRADLFEARINDVTKLLGHPDEEELGEQSDKVYIYYVAPGTQCAPGHPRATLNRVMLRSGATGTVTEVILPVLPK